MIHIKQLREVGVQGTISFWTKLIDWPRKRKNHFESEKSGQKILEEKISVHYEMKVFWDKKLHNNQDVSKRTLIFPFGIFVQVRGGQH